MPGDEAARRARIRAQTRPFPREQHYSTGWNGEMTFEQICDVLTPSINHLMCIVFLIQLCKQLPDIVTGYNYG